MEAVASSNLVVGGQPSTGGRYGDSKSATKEALYVIGAFTLYELVSIPLSVVMN